MRIPMTKENGQIWLEVPDELVKPFEQLLTTLKDSSTAEAGLADSERDARIAELQDVRDRFAEQIATVKGFASLAEAAHLMDSDEEFVTFAKEIRKGHLLKSGDTPQAAVAEPEPATVKAKRPEDAVNTKELIARAIGCRQ